jgi:hypothetical protein
MDAMEILATGAVAVASGGLGAWINHVIGAKERREGRLADEERDRLARLRAFRLEQVDAILNYCVDSLDKIKAATARPPAPLTFAPPMAARTGLIADVDTLERYSWAVDQAEQGILPTSVVDLDGLDGLRGEFRRLWKTQHERVLRDQEPEELPRDEGDPVMDRVAAARDAIRDGRAARVWRPRP